MENNRKKNKLVIKKSKPKIKTTKSMAKRVTSKYAYVFLLMRGDRYLPGIIVAAYQLRKLGAKQDIVVMVTKDVDEKARKTLLMFVTWVVEVPYIFCNITPSSAYISSDRTEITNFVYDWMNISFTRWNCLRLVMYEKVLTIDADALPIANIEELFDIPAPAGVLSMRGSIENYNSGKLSPKEIKKIIDTGYHTFTAALMLLPTAPGMYKKFINTLGTSGTKGQEMSSPVPHDLNSCFIYGQTPKTAENVVKFKTSGEDELAIVRFFRNYTWHLIPSIYMYIPYGNLLGSEYLSPYTTKDVKMYSYYSPVKEWEKPVEQWIDSIKYHKVMKEIEKKYKIKLYRSPPQHAVDAENKKDKFRSDKRKEQSKKK